MEEYYVDPVRGLLELACSNEPDFGVADEPGWFPFNFEDNVVYDLRAFGDPVRSTVTHPPVSVRY